MTNQAELLVLSACFSQHMERVAESVRIEYFEDEFAKKVFKYALDFYYESSVIPAKEGLVAAFDSSDKESKLQLELLTAKLVPGTNIDEGFLIQKVKDLKTDFQKRRIKELTSEISNDKTFDFRSKVDKIRSTLFEIESLSDNQFQTEVFTSEESGRNLVENYEENKKKKERFYLGVDTVDEITGGGSRGKIMLYAAPSSHGKTTALLNHAYNVVVNQGKNVLFAEAEMSMEDIRACIYIIHAYKKFGAATLDSKNFFHGKLTNEEEKALLEEATKDFAENPAYGKFFYMQAAGKSVESVFSYAENLNKIHGIDMIVLDYLSKFHMSTHFKSYREIIDSLFRFAEEKALSFGSNKGVFIVTAHQLNKVGQDELKSGKRHGEIAHTDIKESSEVVNLANTVVGIYDPSMVNKHEFAVNVTATELIFSFPKNRLGGTPKAIKVEVNKKVRVLKAMESPDIENGNVSFDKPEVTLDFEQE